MNWYAVGRHKSGELEFFLVTGLHTLLQLSIAYSIAINYCIPYSIESKQLKIWPESHFWSDRLDRIDSIGSTRSDRLDRINSIGSNRVQKRMIFAIFGPIWTQFRSKQLKLCPESHFWSDRLNRIDSIVSTRSYQLDRINSIWSRRSDQMWLSGQILSCLDLNWVQIGPKMAKMDDFCHFWSDLE